MKTLQTNKINFVLNELFRDSKNDRFKILKGFAKSVFKPIEPSDFKDVYLSISKEQGQGLVDLITENEIKNIVEFGTSFGISTLYLAQGAKETGGKIVTTELIESKAKRAMANFKDAQVEELIDVRVGDAMKTLSNYNEPIDLLLLDGWKDLYYPLFEMLKPNFTTTTLVYVDNADMADTILFLDKLSIQSEYNFEAKFNGKVVLISMNK